MSTWRVCENANSNVSLRSAPNELMEKSISMRIDMLSKTIMKQKICKGFNLR